MQGQEFLPSGGQLEFLLDWTIDVFSLSLAIPLLFSTNNLTFYHFIAFFSIVFCKDTIFAREFILNIFYNTV